MLTFAVYSNGKLTEKLNLAGAYLVGSDDVPLRAEITFKSGLISCKKRSPGPAGLAIPWNVPGFGMILLETVRLLERAQPYLLTVELARGRLLRINQKLEEWGLIDYEGTEAIMQKVREGRELLIQSLQANSPTEASEFGNRSLAAAAEAAEEVARFHAEMMLPRRKQSGLPRRLFGCAVSTESPLELCQRRLSGFFDFVTVPFVWREIEPKEQTFNWKPLDVWVEALVRAKLPIKGSSLLSFSDRNVPAWLYTWEHDFDTIRDLAFEHARRVINRYGQYIQTWDVISGIHAAGAFAFNFEQLMELTRMTAALAKQAAPRGTAIINLVAPWGEYYARNQRTIPPMLYAEMAVQSGINFDAFGLQFLFGPAVEGMYVRDIFQISSMLDQFAKMSKPVHVTGIQVPSGAGTAVDGPGGAKLEGGFWHTPWTEEVQANWLKEFVLVALSKPFVDSVAWDLVHDQPGQMVPSGGLLRSDLSPKQAFQQFVKLRSDITGSQK